MGAIIRVADVKKRYGKVEAVKGISFSVAQGEVFGLLGPNGAGKTTTIEMVEGLRQPDSGSIEVCGQAVRGSAQSIREQVGVQLQSTAIYPRMKVREAVEFFGGFYPRHLPTDTVLDLVGLTGEGSRSYRALSGGQKQRLALALAIVHDPEVVFLDEATAGMDPQGRRSVWGILDRLKREGKTIFLTTHYMEEAERLCDRIGIVDQGLLVALGAPREIIQAAGLAERITFETDRDDLTHAIAEMSGVTRVVSDYGQVTVFTSDGQSASRSLGEMAAARGIGLRNVAVGPANLEDAFLVLTGRRLG